MKNFDSIKDRIRNRRYQSIIKQNDSDNYLSNNYVEYKEKKKHSFFLSGCIPVLTILVLLLGVLIYAKKDEKGSYLQEKLGINVSFVKLNAKVSDFADKIISLDLFNKGTLDQPVNAEPMYVSAGFNHYMNDTSTVTAVGKGTVILAQKDSKSNFLVVIQHDLGYTSAYYDLVSCNVSLYDRVDDQDVIGAYDGQSVEIIFTMNNVNYDYEKILELLNQD